MFEERSRYWVLKNAFFTAPSGRTITYKQRRFLPQGENIPPLDQVVLTVTDRLDLIAARTIGDPEQFWQICDANNCMNPFDLSGEKATGRILSIPIPQFQEES